MRGDPMTDTPDGKRRGWGTWLGIVVAIVGGLSLLALIAYLLFENAEIHLRVSFAEAQTGIFEEMCQKAETSDPARAAECLQYVLEYYPSGSKQIHGSKLDQIVERVRAESVLKIIRILRTKTGKDFGDDPKRWIEEADRLQKR
jgi:hypothetical protein